MTQIEKPNGKRIPGYPNYLIYPDSTIFNKKTNNFLTPTSSKSGYQYVVLIDNEGGFKKKLLRRLVGLAFVPGRTKKKNEIIVLDGNKSNCAASNLRWGTHQEACRVGKSGQPSVQRGENNPNSKLTAELVHEIRELHNFGFTQTMLANIYETPKANIHKIVNNLTWVQPLKTEKVIDGLVHLPNAQNDDLEVLK